MFLTKNLPIMRQASKGEILDHSSLYPTTQNNIAYKTELRLSVDNLSVQGIFIPICSFPSIIIQYLLGS
jgi:hypothetical protein